MPLKKDDSSGGFDTPDAIEIGSDLEKGMANGSIEHSIPEDVAQSFKEEIDRKRSQYSADESVHDVLTPPLKVSHLARLFEEPKGYGIKPSKLSELNLQSGTTRWR